MRIDELKFGQAIVITGYGRQDHIYIPQCLPDTQDRYLQAIGSIVTIAEDRPYEGDCIKLKNWKGEIFAPYKKGLEFYTVNDVRAGGYGPSLCDNGELTPSDVNEQITQNETDKGLKYDAGKTRWELFPVEVLEEVAKVFTYGAQKYDADNWRDGMKWRRFIGALWRHVSAWMMGEDKDPETGFNHLAHAICCLIMLLGHQINGYGEDDRIKLKRNQDA